MKAKRRIARKTGAQTPTAAVPPAPVAHWRYVLGLLVALAVAFEVYGPSLRGPFLFDDQYLPFSVPTFLVNSWRSWVMGVRPALMLSYWLNYQISGVQTFSY